MRLGLRGRLLGIIMLVIVPAIAVVALQAVAERGRAQDDARASLLGFADVLAANQGILVDQTHGLLAGLATLPEVRDFHGPACDQSLANLALALPAYTGFGVLDSSGTLWCLSQPINGTQDHSALPHYQRAAASGQFAVGDFAFGRISGKPTLGMALPIRDDDGTIRGFVVAALGSDWMTDILGRLDLPVRSAASVVDAKGIIIARVPDGTQFVGQAMPAAPEIWAALATNTSFVESPGIDGTLRIYAFAPLLAGRSATPEFVSIGTPPDVVYEGITERLVRNLAIVTAVGIVAGLAAWTLASRSVAAPARKIAATARRLQAGDLAARTGTTAGGAELAAVAQALDDLASQVERHIGALTQANSMKGGLINRISHELNTPLLPLRMEIASFAPGKTVATPAQQEARVEVMKRNVERLAGIVNSVVQAAQAVEKSIVTSFAPLDLGALVQQRCTATRQRVPAAKDLLHASVADGLLVQGDPAKLADAIDAMIDNAIRFAGTSTPIRIDAHAQGQGVVVDVKDQGPGLTANQISGLFQPFGQVHDTMQDPRPGLGMGLFVAKGIVESHGGKVWARSDGPGRGATFGFSIPLASRNREPARSNP